MAPIVDVSQKAASVIINFALAINLLIFGFYAVQGIIDQIAYIKHYEIHKGGALFSLENWAFVLGLPLVAILSALGLFKRLWPALLSSLAGLCFFLFMTYGFIDWHFDPMEQGRNDGLLYLALVTLCLAGLNLGAFIMLYKKRRRVGET